MLGQLTDEVYRRHLVVTTELATLDNQVATFKNMVGVVSLRVLFVVVLRLFEYRLVISIASSCVLSPIFIAISRQAENTHKAISNIFQQILLATFTTERVQITDGQIKLVHFLVTKQEYLDNIIAEIADIADYHPLTYILVAFLDNRSNQSNKVTIVRLVVCLSSSS